MQTSVEITGKQEENAYQLQRLCRENLADLERLHTAVYKKAPAPGYFEKKYNTAYTGVLYVGFIAYNNDMLPIAYYGVIPCFIRLGEQKMLAAQSADTMTHPDYRYKGMFVALSEKTFTLCRELGIFLVFGFPNQNSYHGAVNKLGWKMTEALDFFSIQLKTKLLSRFRFGISKLLDPNYAHDLIRKIALPLKGLPSSANSEGFATVDRSPEYLEYKSYSSSCVIQSHGAQLWISIKDGVWIGDMSHVNDENFFPVINQLKRIAEKTGLKQVQFHCSPGTQLHALFKKNFTAKPSYPALFQDFGSPIAPEKIKFTFGDIDIF